MSANEIQVDYERLEEIARRIQQRAEVTQEMLGRVQSAAEKLISGGWQGRGAQAFAREMEQQVMPAIRRLIGALEESSRVTIEIIRIMRVAEEEAARPFGQLHGEGGIHAPSGATDTAEPLLPPQIPPHRLFSSEYMESMVGMNIQGAGSKTLNQAMLTLLDENPSQDEIEHALRNLTKARGKSYEEIQASYERFLAIKSQIEEKRGNAVPWKTGILFDLVHRDFVGSTVHMRFGKVVGDALGIDPVFGALLNPTGGMVGPGDASLAMPPEHPLTYHGIFHDAGGFLYNNLGIGPGYNYLGREARDPGSPLTGQEAGIHYWNTYWERTTGEPAPIAGVSEFGGKLLGFFEDVGTGLQEAGQIIGESVVQFLPSI